MPGKHKAVSKSQQRFFGMVHALKKGELSDYAVDDEMEDAADDIGPRIAKQFASTKHKGLPEKVKSECFAFTSKKYRRVCELLSGIAKNKLLNENVERKMEAIRKYHERLNEYWNKEVATIENKCASNLGDHDNYNHCIGSYLAQIANDIGYKFVSATMNYLNYEEKIIYRIEIEKMTEVWTSRKSRFLGLQTGFERAAGMTSKGPHYALAQGALVGNPETATAPLI